MNVTLNIPADAGAERTGASGRRANGGGVGFEALFAEVGQTPDAGRGPRSEAPSEKGEAEDNPDKVEAEDAPRDGSRRASGDPIGKAVLEATTGDEGDSPPAPVAAGEAAPESDTDRVRRRTRDAGGDLAGRRDPAVEVDRGSVPADSHDAEPVKARGERSEEGSRRVAGRSERPDAVKSDRGDHGDGTTAIASAAGVAGVAALQAPTDGDAPAGRAGEAASEQRAQTGDAVILAKGDAANRAAPLGGRPSDAKMHDGSAGVHLAPSARPAVGQAEAEAAPVRFQARGGTAAALAAVAVRDQQVHAAPDKPQAERQGAPSRRADGPIDVRVASYERHLAPAGGRNGTKAAVPGDRSDDGNSAPASPRAAGDAAGSTERPNGPQRSRGWRPLTATAQAATLAPAKALPDQPVAASKDPTAPPDSNQNQGDKPQRADRQSPISSTPTATAEDRRQPVTGATPAAGNPATINTMAAAPAVPLTGGVASGITSALAVMRTSAGDASAPVRAEAMATPAASEPVRAVTLNLDMREYGAVDLRISLKGNAVSIQLKADRAETADALARDDASLREVLHRAGYDTQQLQIDKRDTAGPRGGDAATSASQQPAGGAGSGASSGHADSGERAAPDQRPQARRDTQGFALPDQDTQDAPRQDRYRGPDRLYV